MVGLEDSGSVLSRENTIIPFPSNFQTCWKCEEDKEQQMGQRQQPESDPVPVPSCASEVRLHHHGTVNKPN